MSGTYRHPDDLPARARRLAGLVPGVYISRDLADRDRPLLRLLSVLAESLGDLETAVDGLYEDHFVETASLEALPLLAELVTAKLYRTDAPTNRAVIARYVHWLRRKGTVATLEEVVGSASGWSAEAEEAYRSLLVTQDLNALVLHRGRTAVTWDPIAPADPLSRRTAIGMGPRDRDRHTADARAVLARRPNETIEETLRRLGRPDAGKFAVAPRTVDFGSWAQPHIALVRTSRIADARIEDRDVGTLRPGASAEARGTMRLIPHTDRPNVGFAGFTLDPAGGTERAVWTAALDDEYAAPRLTAAHEPGPTPDPSRLMTRVLTPTALAADGDAVEASGALTVTIDGVTLIGPSEPPPPARPVPFAPVVGDPVLRFADGRRPSPSDTWVLRLIALEVPETIPVTVAGAVPLGAIDAENPATLETRETRGGVAVPVEGPAARTARAGARLALRVTREDLGRGYRRAADASWTSPDFGVAGGSPLTPVVALEGGGPLTLVRLERRPADRIGMAVLRPGGPAGWTFNDLDLSGLALPDRPDVIGSRDGPFLALVAMTDGTVLLCGADAPEAGLGVWQIADPAGAAPTATRLDVALQNRPPARLAPSACLHTGRLFVFGGQDESEDGGRTRSDLWSLTLAGAGAGTWQPHHIRLPREGREEASRIGGTLLSMPNGLVLIGGASSPGTLSSVVLHTTLTGARPRWLRLPDLPLEGSEAGALWARNDAGTIEALIWADRTLPRPYRLTNAESRWTVGDVDDDDSPNPPADGDALFIGPEFLVVGPPPLPPSEVVVSAGDRATIAFLPAMDITLADDMRLFLVSANGNTERWYPDGVLARPNIRLGAGREAPVRTRVAPAPRVGAVERLTWRPLKLRQRSLDPWDQPLALELDDCVGFDPRLGRIVVRQELAPGRGIVSHRVARPDAVGPGFAAPELALPSAWREPAAQDSPEDVQPDDPPSDLPTVRVDPLRAGEPVSDGQRYLGNLRDAVGEGGRRVLIAGSPRLAPTTLPLRESTRTRIGTDSPAHAPFLPSDGEASLSLRERMSAGGDPDTGPAVWLSQLVLEGTLDAHLSAGRIDARWCRLAGPGAVGLRVAGAGLQSGATLRSLPDPMLTVHLFGCFVGAVEVPPWVRLVAAGCVFDAGRRGDVAIEAPGARLRLRHCTVVGRVRTGLLQASSCVFAGDVVSDQSLDGWIRYSIVAPGGRPPMLFKSVVADPSFTANGPGEATYRALDTPDATDTQGLGEVGRTPGAYANRAGRVLEATARTSDFLPLGLEAMHEDRARAANFSMNRRSL